MPGVRFEIVFRVAAPVEDQAASQLLLLVASQHTSYVAFCNPAQRNVTVVLAPIDPDDGAVFVSSQGLYYDTFVAKDPLPREGRFQLLENGVTEFGPGDPEYLGGRWWEDLNGNGIQDEGDHFFLCPLLPPGRTTQ